MGTSSLPYVLGSDLQWQFTVITKWQHCWNLLSLLRGVSRRFSAECLTKHEAPRWKLVFAI